MTLPYSTRRAEPVTAVAGQTDFSFSWRLLEVDDLEVWRQRAGVAVKLVYVTDWSLAPDSLDEETGGTVVLTVPALAGDVITILGTRKPERLSNLVNSRAMTSADFNAEFDAMQMQIQELRRDFDRALRLGALDIAGRSGALPTPVPNAVLGWNSAGTAVENKIGGGAVDAFVWRGAWADAAAYDVLDAVTRGGSSYLCVVAHTAAAATEPGVGASWASVWVVLAAKGDPGLQGTPGNGIAVRLASDHTMTGLNSAVPGMSYLQAANELRLVRVFATMKTQNPTSGLGLYLSVPSGAKVIGKCFGVTGTDSILAALSQNSTATAGMPLSARVTNTDLPYHGWWLVETGASGGTVSLIAAQEQNFHTVTVDSDLTVLIHEVLQ